MRMKERITYTGCVVIGDTVDWRMILREQMN